MKALPLAIAIAIAFTVLSYTPRAEALNPISRADIIKWAQHGVGYSYWWGNGRWRTDRAYQGSCSGSCPRCRHTGSYGADCSGYVAKVWRVPTAIPLTTNAHPYSTFHFYNHTTHWTRINRSQLGQGDAMVYRSGNSGHVILHDRTTSWGNIWSYECASCRLGCLHVLRTVNASYRSIRRNALVEPPQSCINDSNCTSGICSWNGSIYCCRSPGFTGKSCFSDAECTGSQVCAYNGSKFVCTAAGNCGGSSGGGTGGTGGSTGGSGGGDCNAVEGPFDPWTHASLGPSFLLVGLVGAWRRRRRMNREEMS